MGSRNDGGKFLELTIIDTEKLLVALKYLLRYPTSKGTKKSPTFLPGFAVCICYNDFFHSRKLGFKMF